MRKIISLFARNYETDRLVRDEVVPGAEWVLAGEGVATRKLDGSCCWVEYGKLYKRHEVKFGKDEPDGFRQAGDPDLKTGNIVGWLPVGDGPADKYHREAWKDGYGGGDTPFADGTYELVGPKVGGGNHDGANPEKLPCHMLMRHGDEELPDAPRTFDALREYLATHDIEGIVWWHGDGRCVKVKGKDFGLKRGVAQPIGASL